MRIPSLCVTLRATSSCVRTVDTETNGETDRVTRKVSVLAVWMAVALVAGLGVSGMLQAQAVQAQAQRIVLFQAHGYDPLHEPPAMQYLDEKSGVQAAAPQQPPQQPPAQQSPALQAPGQAPQPTVPRLPMPIAGIPNVVAAEIDFQGQRRYTRDMLRTRLFTRKGDPFDPASLQRDFMNLWNTGYFEDLRLEDDPRPDGHHLTFVVREKPQIRTIDYGKGMKTVSQSDVLDRFKEQKVGLVVETPYDPTKVRHAEVVLQAFLAEKGHQFAKVEAKATRVPPNSIKLLFEVDEGPTVKVGKITFTGNKAVKDRDLIDAMKFSKPIGIPKSIYFENLWARTYDQSKLGYDLEMVRGKFQDIGYFKALVLDPKLNLYDKPPSGFLYALSQGPIQIWDAMRHKKPGPPKPGKRVDIAITIEQNDLYHMGTMKFSGVKLFRKPEQVLAPQFKMVEGDIFNISKIRKGMENIKDIYKEFGYINEVTEPDQDLDEAAHKINMIFNIEEDKQFFVKRIEFTGNTTTRDKVIRREILLDEGDMFNHRLWSISILRLNQLGFFEPIKKEQEDDGVKPNNRDGTVDINLKVKEKGKNTIGLTGGVSGISGTFLGLQYQTHNFLGLGETLTFDVQLGTIQRNVLLGFTEPHLFDKRYSVGFTLYDRRYSYDQARQASILAGQNLISYYDQFGSQNLLNYRQNSVGATVFLSYPVGRGFSRVGITYGYDRSNITTFSNAAAAYFDYLNYNNISGPNSLTGITTSKITPSYTYNTVNSPLNPTQGKNFFVGGEFAGIGGTIRLVRPSASFTYYHPTYHKRNTIGFRLLGSYMTGYGGRVAPPYERFYIGGEQDIRGFDIRTISPIGYVPNTVSINVLDSDGSPRSTPVLVNGVVQSAAQTMTIPINQITFPGGDMQAVGNFEYRIPIAGPVTLAAFYDLGFDAALRRSQLTITETRYQQLLSLYPNTNFTQNIQLVPGTNGAPHGSVGLELQVVLPVVQAPFRLYYAYNVQRVETNVVPGLVVDRSQFPNNATYAQALAYGAGTSYAEPAHAFRFTISRTF
jgi:outer membrane protein insertion porin family